MKPLTIEELKALEVGDWVWIVENENAYPNHYFHEAYCRIIEPYIDGLCYGWQGAGGFYEYAEYGTKWIAYKNKEQWENKEDFVYLPRKCGHDVVYIDSSDGVLNAKIVTGYLVHHYEIGNSGLDLVIFYHPYNGEQHSEAICHYGEWWFATEKQAEARLKELRGE